MDNGAGTHSANVAGRIHRNVCRHRRRTPKSQRSALSMGTQIHARMFMVTVSHKMTALLHQANSSGWLGCCPSQSLRLSLPVRDILLRRSQLRQKWPSTPGISPCTTHSSLICCGPMPNGRHLDDLGPVGSSEVCGPRQNRHIFSLGALIDATGIHSVPLTTMSQTAPAASSSSSSSFHAVFDAALESYEKTTKNKLLTHPLATQLQSCDSPATILSVLQDLVQKFEQCRGSNEGLRTWLDPTVNVLFAFSATLGEGVGIVTLTVLPSYESALFSLFLRYFRLRK